MSKDGVSVNHNRDGGAHSNNIIYGKRNADTKDSGYGGSGPASRFFKQIDPIDREDAKSFLYCAKASRRDRNEGLETFEKKISDPYAQHRGRRMPNGSDRFDGKPPSRAHNNHPTVKPTELMRYLTRLVTPPGGTVLDPFMGSGSTGKGAILEGFDFIGIEREEEYIEIARARIAHATKSAKVIVREEKPKYMVTMKDVRAVFRRKKRNDSQLELFDSVDKPGGTV
ncbi:MAG: site-specific DNA-methyltransferase [Anaerolineaceae bacterium]|nr:site-specific DNA-methyltransferase [Anaerolineaceae bacterium]